jgi:hypothetical protein
VHLARNSNEDATKSLEWKSVFDASRTIAYRGQGRPVERENRPVALELGRGT